MESHVAEAIDVNSVFLGETYIISIKNHLAITLIGNT